MSYRFPFYNSLLTEKMSYSKCVNSSITLAEESCSVATWWLELIVQRYAARTKGRG